MASPRRTLSQTQEWIGTSHRISELSQKIHFYDQWASDYDQDVGILDYQAPRLAVDCLASAFPSPPQEALLLDVACGTGLVAVELQRHGFCNIHGVEASKNMLELAKRRGLYQQLSLCILGPQPLPAPSDHYDAVTVVGALSDGQIPYTAVPELLRVTKSGGLVCLTTRANPSNLPYKEALEAELDRLEQAGGWKRVLVHIVHQWERATSEQEAAGSAGSNQGFIPGIIYLYQKQEATPAKGTGV
ncbi:methyltransferase-like protein 27 [Dromiciops gliroides]|uniref:methyltransferase-like protein 27 n=1 Tax=Dromiciops gliroides TaxID=33562 RepID=UPI001CC6D93B|nr:methyltransferase-like protein 27 [Dromiciops gliroides]XP_043861289.1 methyltransferase-like protein 27 [Dromiciops gliroides]